MCAVALAACEKNTDESFSSAIKLTKSEVAFGKSGGTQKVTFTIQNPAGGKVTAEDNAEWLETTVEFNADVVITADVNEGDAREAKVTVKYAGAKDVTITVKQKAGNTGEYDVEFEAKHFEGRYFGKASSNNYNYYVIISDIGATINGEPRANGTYYFFDFYSKVAGDVDYPVLPNGTYTFDAKNTYGDATFSDSDSFYGVLDAEGKYAKSAGYKSATVTVADNKFEAVIEMKNGETHRVKFEGDLLVDSDNITSTFTEDFTFDFTGATISATNYGDIQKNGMQAWFLEAVKDDHLFLLEIFTSSAETPAGTYTKATGSDYASKYIPGYIDEEGLQGTWYAKLTAGSIKGDVLAPIADGFFQIAVNETSATITYAAKDDAGNKIEGSISGAFSIKEPEM